MRVTSKVTNNNNLYYLNKGSGNLNKSLNQMLAQRQVVNLQDDPMSANIGIKLETLDSRSRQYVKNLETGISYLNHTDGRIQFAKSQMDKLFKNIETAANTPSSTAESRAANAAELNEIFKTLVNTGNASFGGRHVFGGSNTTNQPFQIVNGRYVTFTGNQDKVNIVADKNTTMPTNVSGTDIYGNMSTTIPTGDLNPGVNLSTDNSTKLSDLNGGKGVPTGKILVKYSAYPEGLEVDLSGCDTLEDVKDAIEKQTLNASRKLDPREHDWLDGSNLDWHDYQDRYVKVSLNPDGNGISLKEYDLGEPLPQPTEAEVRKGLQYTGDMKDQNGDPIYPDSDWKAGGYGIGAQGTPGKETTVFDKYEYLRDDDGKIVVDDNGDPVIAFNTHRPLSVDDFASNKVATGLGIKGTAGRPVVDPNDPTKLLVDPVKSGFIHGKDLNPALTGNTLLSDLDGYNDGIYTFTNGPKDATVEITETSQDSNNVFSDWSLSGVTIGKNTGEKGELYAHVVNKGTEEEPNIVVEIYTQPIGKATAADLVATGTYDNSRIGGKVQLSEVNNSGLSGSVGIVLPDSIGEAKVNLSVKHPDALKGTVHVPAFEEEVGENGKSLDVLNIASGWNIKGLDKPPADDYNYNPASTDPNGNVSVNYRYDAESGNFFVELSRPAYGDQPAKLIATGSMFVGQGLSEGAALEQAVSGRVEFTGEPGFESVSGSVFIELPAGTSFSGPGSVGSSKDDATSNTYQLQEDAPAGTIVLGGQMEVKEDTTVTQVPFKLSADTYFAAGQTFDRDVPLSNGSTLKAGDPMPEGVAVRKGANIYPTDNTIKAGTVLQAGQEISVDGIAAGTVIPRGSYYSDDSGNGFPAEGMGLQVTQPHPTKPGEFITVPEDMPGSYGYNVRATFATIEDLTRAIEEKGIHVSANISADGKSLEFTSGLAGAWLTVSEDTDCYEQMGDLNNQLSGLDLNGLVKGENSDNSGNVYTEVIFYPPNDPKYDKNGNVIPVRLVGEDGSITEVEPGYYVRVYSDKTAMNRAYEDRDNASMVAEGFVPCPDWELDADGKSTGNFAVDDKNNLQNFGFMNGVELKERNNSGVTGNVNLDYYGGRQHSFDVDANGNPVYDENGNVIEDNGVPREKAGVNYSPYNNDNITVFPGGMRPTGSDYATIQQVDVYDVTPGVHADYNGQIHGTITKNDDGTFEIGFYKDTSHTSITGKSNPADMPYENGVVTIYSVDSSGNFLLDANGDPIAIGTMVVDASTLMDDGVPGGTVDSFTLDTGGLRASGREREENIFSTINDALDAIARDDKEALSDLLDVVQRDIDRILKAQAEVGSLQDKMDMLVERHEDDQVNYSGLFNSRVGLDDDAYSRIIIDFQAAYNAYQAAMQVSSTVMQISLLNYI